jgi:hypothetical protein
MLIQCRISAIPKCCVCPKCGHNHFNKTKFDFSALGWPFPFLLPIFPIIFILSSFLLFFFRFFFPFFIEDFPLITSTYMGRKFRIYQPLSAPSRIIKAAFCVQDGKPRTERPAAEAGGAGGGESALPGQPGGRPGATGQGSRQPLQDLPRLVSLVLVSSLSSRGVNTLVCNLVTDHS